MITPTLSQRHRVFEHFNKLTAAVHRNPHTPIELCIDIFRWVLAWLGCGGSVFVQASVMVEYTYKEALALLESNLATALEKKVSICLDVVTFDC